MVTNARLDQLGLTDDQKKLLWDFYVIIQLVLKADPTNTVFLNLKTKIENM